MYLLICSPPSPELERPPIVFMAIASASCASGDKAPNDIPAVSNLLTILFDDSTLLTSIDLVRLFFISNRSLKKLGFLSLISEANFS